MIKTLGFAVQLDSDIGNKKKKSINMYRRKHFWAYNCELDIHRIHFVYFAWFAQGVLRNKLALHGGRAVSFCHHAQLCVSRVHV